MVLDSSAVLAIHLQESGFRRVFERLEASKNTLIGTPTLFETAMVLSSRVGEDARPLIAAFMRRHGVTVVAFTEEHYRLAADAFLRYGKGRHRAGLNFGDCMSYATAILAGMPLLYVGNDFSQTDIRPALH